MDGGAGDDTITSGAGDDIFVYSGGDDVFTDYTAGKDSIMVALDDIENIEVETVGSDLIYHTAEGTFKVTKGLGKEIVLIDEDGKLIELGGKLPDGWKYGTSAATNTNAEIVTATLKTAEEIDLTQNYKLRRRRYFSQCGNSYWRN